MLCVQKVTDIILIPFSKNWSGKGNNTDEIISKNIDLKYKNKILHNNTTFISTKKIEKIHSTTLLSKNYAINVTFEHFAYKLFENELLEGKIVEITESRAVVETDWGHTVDIFCKDFFDSAIFNSNVWCWKYDEDHLFKMVVGDSVRLKLKIFEKNNSGNFRGKMNFQGLGPKFWWPE